MEKKNRKTLITFIGSIILLGVLGVGSLNQYVKGNKEFLDNKHLIDSTYRAKKDSLLNSYKLSKELLEKEYQTKTLKNELSKYKN